MYIKVRVTAGARKEEFTKVRDDLYEVKVREKAERNMANTRVIQLVANHFSLPVGKVKILNGHQSPSKLLVINNE